MMTSFNWITIVITGTSSIVALLSFFKTKKWAKSLKENEMSKSLYDDYLIKKLPKLYEEYVMSNDWTNKGKILLTSIKQFRRSILYFQYSHYKIYEDVLNSIEEIEKIISEGANEQPQEKAKRDRIELKLSTEFNNIYKAFLVDLPNDRIEKYFKQKNK